MPERSFGRTVRYRRTKLGLSQAKLGELVGRSTATIKSWERGQTRPNDEKVLSALAAILGMDERQMFEKADVERPAAVESSPTVEQALATLSIEENRPRLVDSPTEPEASEVDDGPTEPEPSHPQPTEAPRPISVPQTPPPPVPIAQPVLRSADSNPAEDDGGEKSRSEGPPLGSAVDAPAYVAPPEPYLQTPLTPTLADLSYIEDHSQRQLYRVRTLATLVAFVALVVAFVWAVGEGIGALGDWWNEFFGNLRL